MSKRIFSAVFFSHCFVPLTVLAFVLLGILSTYFAIKIPSFPSLPKKSLIFSDDPFYITQLSDLHYTHLDEKTYARLTKFLVDVIKNYNPMLFLVTGDISDGTNTHSMFSYHMQYEGNWDAINRSFNEAKVFERDMDRVFIAGNHDMFAVAKDDMKSNKFRAMFYNESIDFEFQQYRFANNKINMVCFNPLVPPFPSAPFGVFPYVNKKLLNKLENAVDKNALNILVNHFPRRFMFSLTSKHGRRIRQVASLYDVMLTGHRHPQKTFITTHDGLLHVTAPAGKAGNWFTLTTIDNGFVSSHHINSAQTNQAVITYPIPADQLTPKVVFEQNNLPIRVLFFGNKTDKLQLKIDGKIEQKPLVLQKVIKENVSLLSCDVTLRPGEHNIEVVNGNYNNTYFIGECTETKYSMEVLFKIYRISSLMFTVSMTTDPYLLIGLCIFMCFYTFVRVLPIWKINFVKEKLDKFSKFMRNETDNMRLLEQLLCGVLDYFTKYKNLPMMSYIVMIVLTVWVYFIPFILSGMDQKHGIVFMFGMATGTDVKFMGFTFLVWIVYDVFYVLGLGTFASYFYEEKRCIWELVLAAIPVVVLVIAWPFAAYITGLTKAILGSPFTWIGLCGIVFIIVDMIGFKRKPNEPTNDYTDFSGKTDL